MFAEHSCDACLIILKCVGVAIFHTQALVKASVCSPHAASCWKRFVSPVMETEGEKKVKCVQYVVKYLL